MNKEFGAIFWIHLFLIVVSLSTPFWLDWKFILIGIVILQLQWLILDGCYLTFLETGRNKDITFWYLYLSKIWPNLNMRKTKLIVRYLIPVLVLITAYLLQAGSNTIY